MNISGKIKVRAKVNEITGSVSYRTTLVNTRQDGEKEFMTIFLNLIKEAKNKPIDDNSYIDIKNGFLAFNTQTTDKVDKNTGAKVKVDESVVKLVISDFDYIEEMQGFESLNAGETYDDGLPF